MRKAGAKNVDGIERARVIADRATGKPVTEVARLHSLSRRAVQAIMQPAREDDVDAYQRFCGAAKWGALTILTAAIEDLAARFTAEAMAKIEDPVALSRVLADLARTRRDLMSGEAVPGTPGAPPPSGSPTNIKINLMTDEEWNARHAARYPDAPAAALPKTKKGIM